MGKHCCSKNNNMYIEALLEEAFLSKVLNHFKQQENHAKNLLEKDPHNIEAMSNYNLMSDMLKVLVPVHTKASSVVLDGLEKKYGLDLTEMRPLEEQKKKG